MHLHLEGFEDLDLPRDRVFQLLTDSSFIAKSLADAKDTKVRGESGLEARLRIRTTLLTVYMAVRMSMVDKVAPRHVRLRVEGEGAGSNLSITSDIDLEGETSTRMRWAADAEITGLIAGIGPSVLKGFAERKVKEIFAGLKSEMLQASP